MLLIRPCGRLDRVHGLCPGLQFYLEPALLYSPSASSVSFSGSLPLPSRSILHIVVPRRPIPSAPWAVSAPCTNNPHHCLIRRPQLHPNCQSLRPRLEAHLSCLCCSSLSLSAGDRLGMGNQVSSDGKWQFHSLVRSIAHPSGIGRPGYSCGLLPLEDQNQQQACHSPFPPSTPPSQTLSLQVRAGLVPVLGGFPAPTFLPRPPLATVPCLSSPSLVSLNPSGSTVALIRTRSQPTHVPSFI